jgi:RNA polymerase sigma-70 factor, ECF subfamily
MIAESGPCASSLQYRNAIATGAALGDRHGDGRYNFLQKSRWPTTSHHRDWLGSPSIQSQWAAPLLRRRHPQRERSMTDIHMGIETEIPRLRRYARALTRDRVAADDLVQDCLARALSKVHLWQQGTDLRAWLFTILHNQYVNFVRRSARECAAIGLSETEPMLAGAGDQVQRLEVRDLERALSHLPEEQRTILLLVAVEGLRYDEVARMLDVPVGTVRSRLSRGREALRRHMGMTPPVTPACHRAAVAARRDA